MSHALDAIDKRMHIFVRQGIAAPPLGMQIADILGDIGERIADLVIEGLRRLVQQILDCDARAFAERHLPIAVERAVGIGGDGQRIHMAVLRPAVAEQIAKGELSIEGVSSSSQ